MTPDAAPDSRLYAVQVVRRGNWHVVASSPQEAERAAEQQARAELGGQWVADPAATVPWEFAHPDRRDNSSPAHCTTK